MVKLKKIVIFLTVINALVTVCVSTEKTRKNLQDLHIKDKTNHKISDVGLSNSEKTSLFTLNKTGFHIQSLRRLQTDNPCKYKENKCVEKEKDENPCENYEPVAADSTCKPCENGLKSKDGEKCVNNCRPSAPYLLNGECSKTCEIGSYYLHDKENKVCYKCDDSCSSCDYDTGKCKCKSGFEPNSNENNDKICKPCAKGYYSENGESCIDCHCKTQEKCSSSSGVCKDKCIDGYVKENEVCSKCDEGYVEKRKGLCVKCKLNEEENSCIVPKSEGEENDIEIICKNFEVVEVDVNEGKSKQCKPCSEGFYSIKGKSCFKCKYDQSQRKCVNADDQTKNDEDECQYFGLGTSTSGFECKPCEEGKYSVNGKCVDCNCQSGKCKETGECLDEKNEFGDNICVSGFYKDSDGKCVNCHCEGECDTKGNCISILKEGIPVQCIEGYFTSSKNQCLKCTFSNGKCVTSEDETCKGFRYDEESSSCVVVEDGYYSENGIDAVKCNCVRQCEKISGKCDGNCFTGFYKNEKDICVKCVYETGDVQECKIPKSSEVCKGVIPDIDNSNSLECKICPDDEYSIDGKECNKLKVIKDDGGNKVCYINDETVEGFEVSEDGKSCKPCESGYYSEKGKCIICRCKGDCDPKTGECTSSKVECESGYYVSNKKCLKCIDHCLDCSEQNKCNTCEADYQKIELSTSDECVKCRNVGGECKYEKDGKTYLCKDFILENGKCSKTCGKNQSPSGDGVSCINCSPNCESCDNDANCLKCEIGYYLDKNKKCINTIPNCIEIDTSEQCINCLDGFYLDENKCVNCNCKGECVQEDGIDDTKVGDCKGDCDKQYSHLFNGHDSLCNYCEPGFYSTNGKNCVNCHCKDKTKCDARKGCLGECEDGYAKTENSDICDICAKGYVTNENNYECTECAEGYYKDENKKCVYCNCEDDNKCDSNGKCTNKKCAEGFFYEEGSGRCFKCFENVQEQVCSYKDGNNQIKNCLGFELAEGKCKKCIDGRYSMDGSKCYDCHCFTCDSKTGVCEGDEDCEEGYRRSDKKICSKCAAKYIKDSSGKCIKCVEENKCLLCDNGFYLFDEKCDKYIYNTDDNKCHHYSTQDENPQFIYDITTAECKPCVEKSGFFYSKQCLKSHCSGVTKEDGSCEDEECISGYYYDTTKYCVNCNCKGVCDKDGLCSESCDENGENCSGICLEGFFKYQPQTDINKFYCLKCSPGDDETCMAKPKDLGDVICEGFELVDETCQICDEGEYSSDGKKCLKCNCDGECDSKGNCKGACSKGYIHEDEYNNANNKQEPSGKCVKCKYEKNKDKDKQQCETEEKKLCLNFYPDEDDTKEFGCLPCSEGTFSDKGTKCNNCLNNCIKCDSGSKCKKCVEGSLLKANSDKEDECIMCTVNKGICMAGENICKGHEPNGLSCQLCELGSYSIDGKKCVECGCEIGVCDQYTGECLENKGCADGFYERDKVCVKCSDGCLKCENGDYCDECDSEAGYIKYEGEKIECVKCQRNGGKCQYSVDGEEGVCNEFGYNEINKECEKCEHGIYAKGDGTICVNCIEGCKECKNGNQCEACLVGFFKTPDKQCVKCPDNCKKCITDPKSCDTCYDGFYVKNDQCVNCHCKGKCGSSGECEGDCETGYSHSSGGKCYKCVANVDKEVCEYYIDDKSFICKGHDQNCQSCPQGFYSHDAKECVKCHCKNCGSVNGCSSECEIGYAKSENSDICDICDEGYLLDEENNYECSKCKEKYYKNTEKKCVKCNCDENVKCDVNGKCTDGKCAAGFIFVESFGLCFKCSKNVDTCTYEIGNKQMICEGFELLEGGACKKCDEGKFSSDGKECKNCVSNCEKCNDTKTCEKCKDGFHKTSENNEDKCIKCSVDNCAKCSNSTTCDKCEDQYFLTEEEGKSKCFKCENVNGENKCKYTTTDNKKVICENFGIVGEECKACDEGYFSDDGHYCYKCQHNCEKCTGTKDCTKCSAGFYMGDLVNGSPCNRCSSQLDNCAECDKATECKKCIGGYYKAPSISKKKDAKESRTECFDCNCDGICDGETGGCTGDCKKGYYHEKEGEICLNCVQFSEKCTKCDKEKCLECSEEFKVNTNKKDQCVIKACEIGCKVCDEAKAVCTICEDKYFKSNNSCEPCLNSCATCATTESQCTTCNLPLILDNSKCVSCFKKYYGCESESCTDDSCSKCLEYFKTNDDGQCDKSKKAEFPNFNFVGFGRYQKTKSKIIFRLYLKLESSMMFNSKVTFDLKIIINGKETTIKGGEGVQTGTADGYYAERPTGKNTLVNIDCEIALENEISDNAEVYVENLFVVLVNDEIKNIPISNEKLNENINDKIGYEIEENAEKKGALYTFIQNEVSCNNDGTNTNLQLNGIIESKDILINKIFNIKTSGKNANCKLNKDADSTSAKIDCKVVNNEKGFTISNQDVTIENDLTVSLLMKDEAAKLCTDKCCKNCNSCNDGECLSCESGYYLSNNYCFSCPNHCGSTCSSEDKCNNNCADGLFFEDGKCYSCFEKFYGCQSNSCQSGKCTKCLKNFKTDVEGECDKTKKPSLPKFKYGGFGRFKREGKKITFRLYLKIDEGFMYNLKITFTLKIKKTTQGRVLQELITYSGGEGIQTGAADGDQATNPTASSNTANIDCTITSNSDFPEGETTVHNVIATYINEDDDNIKVSTVDSTVDISEREGTDFEDQNKKIGYIYHFYENSYSCNCDGKNAVLQLNGKVQNVEKSIDNIDYDFNTEENDNGNCKLYKKADESDATLNCIISTNKNEFNINDKTLNKEYDSTAYVYVKNKQISCQVSNKENSNPGTGSNGGSKKSSSGGLSGGAIAGIVIGAVVGVAIIGGVIFVIYKAAGTKEVISSTSSVSTTNHEINTQETHTNGKLNGGYSL